MPQRGEVYFPDKTLPPGQSMPHRCVVLSPTNLMATHPNTSGNRLFVTVAIIRSAKHQNGTSVRQMLGHSIPITPQDLPSLQHDSLIETHQVFAVELDAFKNRKSEGKLPLAVMNDVLSGVRRLFT